MQSEVLQGDLADVAFHHVERQQPFQSADLNGHHSEIETPQPHSLQTLQLPEALGKGLHSFGVNV
jgi:hypothetical protein